MYEKTLVFNDIHIPFENSRAVNLMLGIGQELNPDIVVINGDLMDCWEISRYVKNPDLHSSANIKYEIERTKGFLKELRYKFPKARIIWIFGNHEYRWSVYIGNNARELHGLKGLSLEEQVETKESRIEVINSGNKESVWQYGKLLIGHFDRVNKHSGYTAKNLLEDKSISLIQGHVHRGGSSYRRLYDRDIVAYENFCLCDRNPTYVDHPNWQLGFSVVYKDLESDFFYVEQHPIAEITNGKRVKYKCFYNGKVYEQ